jgi:ketosteroid isomerase-like protein
MFDARRWGRTDEVLALLDEDAVVLAKADGRLLRGLDQIRAYLTSIAETRRVEVSATRLEASEDAVTVHGRLRVFSKRGMSDSPATWVVTVRDGRIRTVK